MYSLLHLTCSDLEEANKISQVLLKKKLVACVKKTPVNTSFLWENEIKHDQEVLMVMEAKETDLDEIEKVVAENHSYDTFVLLATPITHVSEKASRWLREELTN